MALPKARSVPPTPVSSFLPSSASTRTFRPRLPGRARSPGATALLHAAQVTWTVGWLGECPPSVSNHQRSVCGAAAVTHGNPPCESPSAGAPPATAPGEPGAALNTPGLALPSPAPSEDAARARRGGRLRASPPRRGAESTARATHLRDKIANHAWDANRKCRRFRLPFRAGAQLAGILERRGLWGA